MAIRRVAKPENSVASADGPSESGLKRIKTKFDWN